MRVVAVAWGSWIEHSPHLPARPSLFQLKVFMAELNNRALAIRPKDGCEWDLVSLGEVMLRLDPGGRQGRHQRASFAPGRAAARYNVARGLRRCFGMNTAIVSALADNAVGRLLEDLMLQGGVSLRHLRWVPFDGVGRISRNGLNFTERGFGVRAASGCSDRGHTAISQLKPGDVDWDRIFVTEGARWFHTGGIYCAPLGDRAAGRNGGHVGRQTCWRRHFL